jgi:predicted ATP-dependent endonuclease of OLD family
MRFKSFHIKNYKGISDCRIDFDKSDPRVIALIGLNGSGKTTILEAISHFVAGDRGLQRVYGIDTVAVDKSQFIPKTKEMNFNGDISISATLTMDNDDYDAIEEEFIKLGWKMIRPVGQLDIVVTQRFHYENSTYKDSQRLWSLAFKARKTKGTVISDVGAEHPCWGAYFKTTEKRMAQICYFPTFLFDVPDKIFLEDHTDESPINAYYRKLIQDILDSLDQGISLETHVVDRVKGVDGKRTWSEFVASDERAQVTHVLNSAAAKITQVIMQSWKRVFKKDFDNKRIEIEYEVDAETTILCIKLYLEDFPDRYKLKDRSLGFQWFFCFWLFTHFRTLRADKTGVIFLLDEPAANLHATAQVEILNSLGKLAYGENVVMYSTHSHYLVNPAWLDRAFVISDGTGQNGAVAGEFSNKLPTAISAIPYRQFARKHSSQRTYYLPILDALDYKPSELTLSRPSLIVEGKADAAFFAVAFADVHLQFSIVPAGGAMSMAPLISLLAGWGFPAVCLLDDDGEGRSAVSKYASMALIEGPNISTLAKFGPEYAGLSLEELIIKEWGAAIKLHFGAKIATKELAQAFVYESFASSTKPALTPILRSLAEQVLKWANGQMAINKKRKLPNT